MGYGEPMRFPDRRGTASPELHRWLDESRLPLPHIATQEGEVDWEETVFAHLLGREFKVSSRPSAGAVLVVHALCRPERRLTPPLRPSLATLR